MHEQLLGLEIPLGSRGGEQRGFSIQSVQQGPRAVVQTYAWRGCLAYILITRRTILRIFPVSAFFAGAHVVRAFFFREAINARLE